MQYHIFSIVESNPPPQKKRISFEPKPHTHRYPNYTHIPWSHHAIPQFVPPQSCSV